MRKSIFSVVCVAAVAAVFCFGCNRDWNKVTPPDTTEPETTGYTIDITNVLGSRDLFVKRAPYKDVYDYGETVVLTAVVAAFDGVTESGDTVWAEPTDVGFDRWTGDIESMDNPLTVFVTEDLSLTVKYKSLMPVPPISAKADTLCAYYGNGVVRPPVGLYVIQNEAQITSFLETSGYYDNGVWIAKEITSEPNFEERTYFAYRASNFGHNISSVLYGSDTVTVIYENIVPQACIEGRDECYVMDSLPPGVFVYSIPFTEKVIKIEEVEVGKNF